MAGETGDVQRNTLRLLGELGEVLTIHAAPPEGPDRHNAYVSFLLARRKNQPVICDFTPAYGILPADSLSEMAAIGGARFVVVLRDPAERLWAQICAEITPGPARAEQAAAVLARALAAGGDPAMTWPEADYAGLFARLDSVVAPDRILALFHERLPARAELDRLTAFADIPPVPEVSLPPLPEDRTPPIPPGQRGALAGWLAPQYAAMQQRFGSDLPPDWATPGPQDGLDAMSRRTAP
jgi:hypothetical protein